MGGIFCGDGVGECGNPSLEGVAGLLRIGWRVNLGAVLAGDGGHLGAAVRM